MECQLTEMGALMKVALQGCPDAPSVDRIEVSLLAGVMLVCSSGIRMPLGAAESQALALLDA